MSLFLSFLGGMAEGASKQIEKAEEEAKAVAISGVKTMHGNMQKIREQNRILENKLKDDKDFILAYHPKATPDQINELLARPTVMEAFRKYKDPGSVSLDSLVKISQVNVNDNKAAEKITALPEIIEKARAAIAPQGEKRTGAWTKFKSEFADVAGRTAQEQTAAALGTTMQELTGTTMLQRPTARGEVDMSVLTEKKSFTQREDDAKTALLDAQKSGDEAKVLAAQSELKAIQTVKDEMTPAQTKFANKIADIKQRYMFGTPQERAAAKPEYDKLLSDVRAEAAAKKTGEGGDKIPSLGTLNAFTSSAVARRVAEVHGDLIRSKQLAIIEKPDGSSSLEYTGDNPELRKQINNTAYTAAQNALSLYMTPNGEPMTRDVAAVLNTYVPQSVMKQPAPAAQTPAAAPTAQVRAFKTVEEAEAARLPKGTKITINGRPAEVQ